jgi:Icc-related predicted phosphoesterase
MLVSAISDLEPLEMDFEPFWDVLKIAKEPDIFLLAGDIYEYRNPEIYGLILDFFKLKKWSCPIVAVFGNREFDEDIDDIKKITKKRITFLDDESLELKINGKKLGIVGTRGSLDFPTWWQSTHVPDVRKAYLERTKKCEELLDKLKVDIKILLSHYSPTYKTLVGENPKIYGALGFKKFENILIKTKTTFAVHGHAHYGIPLAFVEGIPVFNVAFTVNKKIVEIDTDKMPKTGLHKFVR